MAFERFVNTTQNISQKKASPVLPTGAGRQAGIGALNIKIALLVGEMSCWRDGYNGKKLLEERPKSLLRRSNYGALSVVMKKLGIEGKDAVLFKTMLSRSDGNLKSFLENYEQNRLKFSAYKNHNPALPEQRISKVNSRKKANVFLFVKNTERKIFTTGVSLLLSWRTLWKKNMFLLKNKFSPVMRKKKKTLVKIHENIWRYQQRIRTEKKAKIIAFKNKTLEKSKKTLKYAALTTPILGFGYTGMQEVSSTPVERCNKIDSVVNVKKSFCFVSEKKDSLTKVICGSIRDFSPVPVYDVADKFDVDSLLRTYFPVKSEPVVQDIKEDSASSFIPYQDDFALKVMQNKERDMEEFAELYKKCSYENYQKLEYGSKRKAYKEANIALKHYGFSKISQGLHCSGMSMASLCQAADIFIARHPDSPVSYAVKEMLKNCSNVHSCIGLRQDMQKATNSVVWSDNLASEVKKYMKNNKHAIVFGWTQRSKRKFHHQTFFQADSLSGAAYTYCAFNNQHWGNETTFRNYMSSRKRYGNGGYFFDIGSNIDAIATRYANQEIAAYKVQNRHDLACSDSDTEVLKNRDAGVSKTSGENFETVLAMVVHKAFMR